MKLQSEDTFHEVKRSTFDPEDTPGEDDILLNITVRVKGYSAADQIWVVARLGMLIL